MHSKLANREGIWNYLFDDKVLLPVLQWSNARLAKVKLKYKNVSKSDIRDLDMIQLKAFLELLLLTSIYKSNTEYIRFIFATDGSGRDIFRCVMNANRFATLLICLRFDNPEIRFERNKQDPFRFLKFFMLFPELPYNLYIKNRCMHR